MNPSIQTPRKRDIKVCITGPDDPQPDFTPPSASYSNFKPLDVPPGHIVRVVNITFHSARARSVALRGDFLNPHQPPLPMIRQTKGRWRIQLWLTPGCYRFQFVVDGVMLEDTQPCATRLSRPGALQCGLRIE